MHSHVFYFRGKNNILVESITCNLSVFFQEVISGFVSSSKRKVIFIIVKHYAFILFVSCSLFLINPKHSFCETSGKPVFELGVFNGALTIPQYEGSDKRYNIPIIFPYFVYRGDSLKIDKGGIRKYFFDSEKISLDLGFSVNLPVDSNANETRAGMEDIPFIVQIGPRLNYYFINHNSDYIALLRFPIRSGWNMRNGYSGLLIQPTFLVGMANLNGRWKNYCEFALTYTSSEYNKIFYDVDAAYSNKDRPKFETGNAMHSFSVNITSLFDISRKVEIGSYVKWRTLGIGRVAESPLVRQNSDYSGGIFLTWALWESKERIEKSGVADEADEDVL